MDVVVDADLFPKTPVPLVKTVWVSIVAYKYQLKKAISHFIKHLSNFKRVPTCARLKLLLKGPSA